jgi:hypothetical protein
LLSFVVFRLQTTLFHSISHFTKYSERKGAHPPLPLGIESLIERLPRMGLPLKVGRSLRQATGAFLAIGNAYCAAPCCSTRYAGHTHRCQRTADNGLGRGDEAAHTRNPHLMAEFKAKTTDGCR